MKKNFKNLVVEAFERNRNLNSEILSKEDIANLPAVIQKYIRVTGFLGKEKIRNFRAEFRGGIRSGPADKFMSLHSVQYNFFGEPTRIFYITAKKMGIPAVGIHCYKDKKATMLIRILGIFTVADAKGPEMDQGETVTLFNDMCLIVPGSLIDKNIKWEELDDKTVKAFFRNGDKEISATLYFNDVGELINFISDDRFETTDGKTYRNYPWSTPVSEYCDINGYHLPCRAELIYSYPDQEFCYGNFVLSDVRINTERYY